MPNVREVSTRLLRPTLPDIDLKQVMDMVANFNEKWESDGQITVFDEGIAQCALADQFSYSKYYASLILGKAGLRCTVIDAEPVDILESKNNTFTFIGSISSSIKNNEDLKSLKEILSKRGYHFSKISFIIS